MTKKQEEIEKNVYILTDELTNYITSLKKEEQVIDVINLAKMLLDDSINWWANNWSK